MRHRYTALPRLKLLSARRVRRRRSRRSADASGGESQQPEPSARRCANVDGFSVHANVSLPAHQRAKLENLCRYMLRPPLAVERLERLASGRLAYRMKTPWRDGTTHVTMSDGELVEKLAALVPAPRFHLVRYFGILASAAKQRSSIVPVPPPASHAESCGHRDSSEKEKPHARNYYLPFPTMSRSFHQHQVFSINA